MPNLIRWVTGFVVVGGLYGLLRAEQPLYIWGFAFVTLAGGYVGFAMAAYLEDR